MIVAWALYAILVSTLLTLAAGLVGVGLRLYGRAARWAWAAAIAGSVLWPVAALAGLAGASPWPGRSLIGRLLSAGETAATGRGAMTHLPAAEVIEVPGARAWLEISALLPSAMDHAFVVAWSLASAILLGIFLRSWRELQRRRRTWEPVRIAGTEVLLSRETGPAVMGLLRSTIVLPSWVRDLEPDRRELVVVHELEHLRAGDSRLLGTAFLVVALVPWNPLLWLQLHRLRLAVELDCDRRVVRRGTGPGRYGRFLVNVSGGTPNLRLPATGLAKSRSFLERRIRAMTRTDPRFRHIRALAVLLAAGGALALACDTPAPTGDADVEARGAAPSSADANPAFVPRDVEPQLRNGDEVRDLLQESYPPLLKDAGIEGRVVLWMKVDTDGEVEEVRIQRASDYEALDEAAVEVGRSMRFSPAEKDGEPISLWIAQPVAFEISGLQAEDGVRAGGPDRTDEGGDRAFRIRGTASVADASPLVFVDDVEIPAGGEPLQPGSGALADLSPDEIERIEVVKGEAARVLYGDEAAGGVILITTKEGG